MEERIKYLLRKYLDNDCTKEEFEEIFLQLQQVDRDILIGNSIEEAYRQELKAPVAIKHYKAFIAVAAAILILIIAGASWLMRSPDEPASADAAVIRPKESVRRATERSEYKYLLLPDSTQVWLNAESTLEFPQTFAGKKRREVVLKGEAYFDVKHADKMPFLIYTGKVSTEVLGTAFNIKAYPDMEKITVSVKRGKVKVNYNDHQVALLIHGQQVSIGQRQESVKEKQIREEESSAWHEGNLVYDDYLVSDIIADLARIYDVKIDLSAKEVGDMRVSTSFRREHGIESALDIICRLTDSHLLMENGVYKIKRPAQLRPGSAGV